MSNINNIEINYLHFEKWVFKVSLSRINLSKRKFLILEKIFWEILFVPISKQNSFRPTIWTRADFFQFSVFGTKLGGRSNNVFRSYWLDATKFSHSMLWYWKLQKIEYRGFKHLYYLCNNFFPYIIHSTVFSKWSHIEGVWRLHRIWSKTALILNLLQSNLSYFCYFEARILAVKSNWGQIRSNLGKS